MLKRMNKTTLYFKLCCNIIWLWFNFKKRQQNSEQGIGAEPNKVPNFHQALTFINRNESNQTTK
jgi:hypothetical protein